MKQLILAILLATSIAHQTNAMQWQNYKHALASGTLQMVLFAGSCVAGYRFWPASGIQNSWYSPTKTKGLCLGGITLGYFLLASALHDLGLAYDLYCRAQSKNLPSSVSSDANTASNHQKNEKRRLMAAAASKRDPRNKNHTRRT